MATYYIRRPPPSASRASFRAPEEAGRSELREALPPLNSISADHSIYVFPSPPSAPPSPGSSLFSAPTDFEPFGSSSLGSRSRASSNAAAGAFVSEGSVGVTGQDIPPTPENEMELDVELWELSTDPATDISDTDESWVLEDEVERISVGDIHASPAGLNRSRRMHRLSSPYSPDGAHANHYWVVRPHRRPRSHSRLRTISSLSSSLVPPSARRSSPHPRIHIPLLSFFSSLLSVDLDDPALRLLTHADPGDSEAVLFPGHTTAQLLSRGTARAREHDDDETDVVADVDADGARSEGEQLHGLPKLLLASFSDQSAVALRSLRAGLSVVIPQPPDIALPIPDASRLFGLWRVLGEVCARSGQAWKEVWSGSPPDSENSHCDLGLDL